MAKFRPIIDEEFYVWVAPDGEMQLALLAPDLPSCTAIAKLWYTSGLGKSPHQMKLDGFTIQKVKISVTPTAN